MSSAACATLRPGQPSASSEVISTLAMPQGGGFGGGMVVREGLGCGLSAGIFQAAIVRSACSTGGAGVVRGFYPHPPLP